MALANRGVTVVAIGDDDQSIYTFRHADPSGIRNFPTTFNTSYDYALVESRRCGSAIINAANVLIQSDPTRTANKPVLQSVAGAPPGLFRYLRFATDGAEADGVAAIVEKRIAQGVPPRDIAILVRSSEPAWSIAVEMHFPRARLNSRPPKPSTSRWRTRSFDVPSLSQDWRQRETTRSAGGR